MASSLEVVSSHAQPSKQAAELIIQRHPEPKTLALQSRMGSRSQRLRDDRSPGRRRKDRGLVASVSVNVFDSRCVESVALFLQGRLLAQAQTSE